MAVDASARTIAQKRFVLESSPENIWDLLATVIFQQLPLEQVDILGVDKFNAVLRWGTGIFSIPFDVQGKLIEVSRPDSLGCVILVKKGPVRFGLKVTMTVMAVDGARAEVRCTAVPEGERTIAGRLMDGRQKQFTLRMFDSIEKRLQQLCSQDGTK
jgi:hypothetical protein